MCLKGQKGVRQIHAIETSHWFEGLVSVIFNLPPSIQTLFVKQHLPPFCSQSWQDETQVRGTASILCIVGWLVSGLKESSIMSRLSEGSPGGLQFQRVTIELFPSASAPCLIEQTFQCPFVEVSYIRTLSATPQNRPYGLSVAILHLSFSDCFHNQIVFISGAC